MKKELSFNNPVYISFFTTFLALSGTTIITVLATYSETVKAEKYIQNALISETCVNIIAGLTYYYFIKYLYTDKLQLEFLTGVRYIDWFLTTPLLLLSFTLYLTWEYNNKTGENKKYDITPLAYIIPLNLLMLVFGYLGETKKISLTKGFILGMIFFGLLMYFVYRDYVNEDSLVKYFWIFTAVWFLYGIAFLLSLKAKNITYNFLDLVSKAGFGIFLWISIMDFGGP